jgi:hypothetical protein
LRNIFRTHIALPQSAGQGRCHSGLRGIKRALRKPLPAARRDRPSAHAGREINREKTINSQRIPKGPPNMRALLVAAGLLAASTVPAFADSVTANVKDWDSASRTITLQDNSQFADIAPTVTVPAALKSGDLVTVSYEVDWDGQQAINSITLDSAAPLLSASAQGN